MPVRLVCVDVDGTVSDRFRRPTVPTAAAALDATEKALAARDRIRAAGIVEGEPFQRLESFADDPAASADGSLLAITIEAGERPPVVVVWSTAPDTAATRRLEEQRERLLAADPEDVPAIE